MADIPTSRPSALEAADGAVRSLHVLEALATMDQPASLSAVARKTALSESSAYRALCALERRGFVDHAGRSGYLVGSRSVALGALLGPRPALLQRARPVLVQLADLASAGAMLHLRSGAHRVLVLGAVPQGLSTAPAMPVGERAPLSSGCAGTAILAHLPHAEAHVVLAAAPRGRQRATPDTLSRIRTLGYALSFANNHAGINGIAAPLLDPVDGSPLGSIALAGRSSRLDEPTLHRLASPLMTACGRLAPRLSKILGPNASERRAALDVTIQHILAP